MGKEPVSKYHLYESAVQSANWQVDYLPQFHQWLTGKKPTAMREDFCGSGKISCEWVKRSKKNRAVGLDIDSEPIDYAESVHRSRLTDEAQGRVTFLRQDVRKVTKEKFDLIGAYNYSFYVFHERKQLLHYAKAALKSLKAKGTFFLELAGGEGFMDELHEAKTLKIPGLGQVQYVWEQHQYDPITSVTDYSIHFQLPDGSWLNDAFTYHWRLWGIREVREILQEAGFKKTVVLWEKANRQGTGSGEFELMENGEHLKAWVAYVVGVK